MENSKTYPCERCGKDTDAEEYIVNFGWCDKCMSDSWVKYLTEIGIDPNLPHSEIETLLGKYYEDLKNKNSNDPF